MGLGLYRPFGPGPNPCQVRCRRPFAICKHYKIDSKKSIFEVGVKVDGFDLNIFWPNSKLELIELRVVHTKLLTLQPTIQESM